MELTQHSVMEGATTSSARETINGDPRVARILRWIEEQLDNPALGCTLLQKAFHVSRPTLYRMFQPLGGVSRYIRERRLLAARRRLRDEPQHSITWLLYDVGFESERQFQRAFNARFGMSPTGWRNLSQGHGRDHLPEHS